MIPCPAPHMLLPFQESHPTPPDFSQAATFAQRVNNVYADFKLTPNWIDDSDCFWYRVRSSPEESTFIYVDPNRGLREPAFNHAELAKALTSQGTHASANNLPFTHIDPNIDGKVIRFRIGGKKFQFLNNNLLTDYDGEITEETLRPLKQEKVSVASATSTTIVFINQLKAPISMLWVDFDGNVKCYGTVEAGHSISRQTFVGHVWRAATLDDEPIASFIATREESTAIIKGGIIPATPIETVATREDSTTTQSAEKDPPLTQDNSRPQAFVRDYNVWIRSSDGQERLLSTTGTSEYPFDSDEMYMSPHGRYVVVFQHTIAQDRVLYHIESSPKAQLQPRLRQTHYLKPDDKRRIDRPRLFDLERMCEIETDESLFANPYRINGIGWSSDATEFRFKYNQRGHQSLRIIGINTDGAVRSIVEETSKTFVDYSQKYYHHHISDLDEMIWASERDGWNHLYLIDLKRGRVKNQITKGEWVVRSVDWVDEDKKEIWFTALGIVTDQEPYHAHLARVDYDGSGLMVFTEGNGTHSWKWSPSKRFLVDTWSRVDLAPRTVLRAADGGNVIIPLEERDFEKLLQVGWRPAERFAAPGRDEQTLVYGIIILPSTFDPSRKYPVIEDIYAGPQDFFVPKAFSPLTRQHELAELGFIVVQIDGMGTNWRSKAFHDHCYKNIRDSGFPDRIAWLKAAAETRSWMDLTRVGIFGSSAGGQSAMAALLWHGDFYKAAVADSGCHDNRMDKLWWNEAWMGWPVDQEAYDNSSNVVHAKKLKGALMLIVGELDDNVDPSSTMQVVNALIESEKDFDLVFVPGADHGVGHSNPYCLRRQRDFFVKHLLGVEPPNRNMS